MVCAITQHNQHKRRIEAMRGCLAAWRLARGLARLGGLIARWWLNGETAEQQQERVDAMRAEMREWRAREVPPAPTETRAMPPDLAAAFGLDTQEGRERYERGRALRAAGYSGPLDGDNRIPDPDDPHELPGLSALAALAATGATP